MGRKKVAGIGWLPLAYRHGSILGPLLHIISRPHILTCLAYSAQWTIEKLHISRRGHFDTILSFIPKLVFELQYYYRFLDILSVKQSWENIHIARKHLMVNFT